MILADWQIKQKVRDDESFIMPFVKQKMGDISYGLSSYGYDIRLSPHDFKIFQGQQYDGGDSIVDPKQFNRSFIRDGKLDYSGDFSWFTLTGLSYGLGVSYERLKIPNNVLGLVVGKSTYARCGLIVNCTPLEPGWEGHITLEFSNSSPSPVRLYAMEGIAQVLFFEGYSCWADYGVGKYQNQTHQVVVAK